jgi:hypothetical protein
MKQILNEHANLRSRGIINGVCFGAAGTEIYCALANMALIQTPLKTLRSLRDMCIDAVRGNEGRQQIGYGIGQTDAIGWRAGNRKRRTRLDMGGGGFAEVRTTQMCKLTLP